nr:polyprotein [Riptortus pedestris virus-1]
MYEMAPISGAPKGLSASVIRESEITKPFQFSVPLYKNRHQFRLTAEQKPCFISNPFEESAVTPQQTSYTGSTSPKEVTSSCRCTTEAGACSLATPSTSRLIAPCLCKETDAPNSQLTAKTPVLVPAYSGTNILPKVEVTVEDTPLAYSQTAVIPTPIPFPVIPTTPPSVSYRVANEGQELRLFDPATEKWQHLEGNYLTEPIVKPRTTSLLKKVFTDALYKLPQIPSQLASALIRGYNICTVPFNQPLPELMAVLQRSDPVTATLALAICNRMKLDASIINPTITLHLILGIIQIILLSTSLALVLTDKGGRLLTGLLVSSLVTSVIQLVTSLKLAGTISTSFPIEDLVKITHGLTERVVNNEGVEPSDARRNDVLVMLAQSYGLSPHHLTPVQEDVELTTSFLPAGSQWKTYDMRLEQRLHQFQIKYKALKTYNLYGIRKPPTELGDHLYKVFAQFRAFDSLKVEEMLAYPANIQKDPYQFLLKLAHHIYQETGVNLANETWPVSHDKDVYLANNRPAFQPQSGTVPSGIMKGIALLLGVITLVTGKKITLFEHLARSLTKLPGLYKDAHTALWAAASQCSSYLYEIFGCDFLDLQAKKYRAASLLDTIRPLRMLHLDNLSQIPNVKKSLTLFLHEGELLLKDEFSGLSKEEVQELRKALDDFARFISTLPERPPDRFRQVPVALYLRGHPGSGKTYFVTHQLNAYLQRELEFTPIQSLSKDSSGHWVEIAEGKHSAFLIDEAGASTEDSTIQDYTKMISEDPFFLPGAYKKNQPFAPELLVFCNNEQGLSSKNMTESAKQALASRLFEFEVTHEDYNPHMDQTRDSLVRNNFENVYAKRVVRTLSGKKVERQEKIKLMDILPLIKAEIMKKREEYQNKLAFELDQGTHMCSTDSTSIVHKANLTYLLANAPLPTDGNTHLYTQMKEEKPLSIFSPHQLRYLGEVLGTTLCVHQGSDIQIVHKGIGKICAAIKPTGPLKSPEVYFSRPTVVAQAGAQDFLTWHVSGPAGVGKTTVLKELGYKLAEVLKFNFFLVNSATTDATLAEVYTSKAPCVILMDDFCTSEPGRFQAFYDQIPHKSILIITSNLKFKKLPWWVRSMHLGACTPTHRVVYPGIEKFPVGWFRRLGYPSTILDSQGNPVPPATKYTLFTEITNAGTLNSTYNTKFLPLLFEYQALEDLAIQYEPRPPIATLPTFQFENFDTFYEIFKNEASIEFGLGKAVLGLHSRVKVSNLPKTVRDVRASLNTLVTTRDENPLDVITRIARATIHSFDFPVVWKFTKEGRYVAIQNGKITHNFPSESCVETFQFYNEGLLYTNLMGEVTFIDYNDLGGYLNGKVTSPLHYALQANKKKIEEEAAKRSYRAIEYTLDDFQRAREQCKGIITSLLTSPWFIIGSIVVALALGIACIVKLFNFFTSDSREITVPKIAEPPKAETQGDWAEEVEETYPELNPRYITESRVVERSPEQADNYSGSLRKTKRPMKARRAGLAGFIARRHAMVNVGKADPELYKVAMEKFTEHQTSKAAASQNISEALQTATPAIPILSAPGQLTIVPSDDTTPKTVKKVPRARYQYGIEGKGTPLNVHTLNKATCTLTLNGKRMQGLFVGGKVIASCSHLYTHNEFATQELATVHEVVDGTVKTWKARPYFYGVNSKDQQTATELLLLVVEDKTFPSKKDITNLFYSAQQMEDFKNLSYTLEGSTYYTVNGVTYMPTLEVNIQAHITMVGQEDSTLPDISIKDPIYAHVVYAPQDINKCFYPGSCGTPIFNPTANPGTPCVYGLHTLYTASQTSISFPVYRETLQDLLKISVPKAAPQLGSAIPSMLTSFGNKQYEIIVSQAWKDAMATAPSPPVYMSEAALNEEKNDKRAGEKLSYVGSIPYGITRPPSQKYKSTGVGHLAPYAPPKIPAPLSPNTLPDSALPEARSKFTVEWKEGKATPTKRGPHIPSKQLCMMDEGISNSEFTKKYQKYFPEVNLLFRDRLNAIIQQRKFEKNLKKEGCYKWRLLTDDEVINGITDPTNPLRDGVSAIETESGAGPTMNLFGIMQKKEMFKIEGQNLDGSPKMHLVEDVQQVYNDVKEMLQKGQIPFLPDQAKLKSELLPPEKVEAGNTRLYISRDAIMMMFEKKVFGMLQALFHKSAGKHFSAIGLDPYNGFRVILEQFKQKGLAKILTADAKRWDKRTLRAIVEQVLLAIKAEAPFQNAEKSSNMFDAVCATILDTYFVCETELFVNNGGVPSGTYITTLLNCCIQEWILCLLLVVHRPSNVSVEKIFRHLLEKFMGDDLFIGVSKMFMKWFPAELIQKFYLSCNVLLTNPKKTSSTITYEDWSEFEFCSRTFKVHKVNGRQVWAFPLKLISVRADSHYSTSTTKETIISICRTKLIEASLHGPEIYAEESAFVEAALRYIGAPGAICIPSWEDKLQSVVPPPLSAIPQGGITPGNTVMTYRISTMSASREVIESLARLVEMGVLPRRVLSLESSTLTVSPDSILFSNDDSLTPLHIEIPVVGDILSSIRRIPSYVEHMALRSLRRMTGRYVAREDLARSIEAPSDILETLVTDHYVTTMAFSFKPQMERSETPRTTATLSSAPMGGATATGTMAYEPAPLQTMGEPPQIYAQPNSESLLPLGDFGDPRNIFDVVSSQKFTTDFVQVDASQSNGTVLMRVPYGFESAPQSVLTILRMHKYFKGPIEHYFVVRGAGATGSVRISHVKDITQDTYTLAQLQETNASFVVDLSQVSQNQSFAIVIDYAHISQKVLPVEPILDGTFDWNPTRPGIVITVNTPVQNAFNPVNPWIEVSRFYGHLVYTTPIVTPNQPPSPGNKSVLTALAGSRMGSFLQAFSGSTITNLALMTDGIYGPDPGLNRLLDGTFEGLDLQSNVTQVTGSIEYELGGEGTVPNNPSNIACVLTRTKTKSTARVVLLDGSAPFDPSAQLSSNLEQVLSTSIVTDKAPEFPFPSLDGGDRATYLATLTSSIRSRLPSAAVIATVTPATDPIKLVSVQTLFAKSDGVIDSSKTKQLDVAANPPKKTTTVIRVQSAQFSFKLWIIDLEFTEAAQDVFEPHTSVVSDNIFPVRTDVTLIFTPISSYSVTPNILSRNYLTQLPPTCANIRFAVPSGSVTTTAGANAGLPTITSEVTSSALRFVLNSLLSGQKAEFVLFSSATGKVAAIVYFSANFQAIYIKSKSGKTYQQWNLEQLSTLIIQSVTVKNESETSQETDDSTWLNRETLTPQITEVVRVKARPQAMVAGMIGAQALGGLFSGISEAVAQQQKQQFEAKQKELDRQNLIKQTAMNNGTQLQLATQNNLSSMKRAELNAGTNQYVARLNNNTTFGVAKLNQATALGTTRLNNKAAVDVAMIGAQNNRTTNETNRSIAELNNEASQANSQRQLEGTKFSSSASLAGSLASSGTALTGQLMNTLINAPADRENALKKIEEQGEQQRKTLQFQQQLLAGANPSNNQ